MNIKLLGATAIAATMLAGSAMAQAVVNEPGRCAAQFPNANCKNLGPGNPYTDRGSRHHRMSYRQTNTYRQANGDWNNDWNRSRTGFWPTDVAAGVAGAAIGTAGAIASAPFRAWDNSYAYDNSWDNRGWDNRGWDTRTYAQRNGFVCTPGTWFKGQDGRRHICQ
ncbi:hypothetical protein JQ599_24490 [Bradyrhizobium diazoefficiens]|jgi:hypothetical protein|uniref:hypothetical protein n=1 Tax=Bradyrhizobium TaxID=374 RepID=UPI0018871ACB|nr:MULTISPECIES: hypothetical protein [Bradyrhizobium]MBR0703086.1 hypothetical protein [Bradyrhizobium diazoefficiens]MBR0771841.1 hypothetical protein [Bradyrhizobium diazoefficiens]MCS3758763.1 hypothetical protein [Bradyrhizobium centrosematis]MCS3773349.1 hypothetical protein [Bradyrhizobium centrosematis]MDT4741781.1 hypothetical protein [Bradyrhizobium sp. WYCCWR 12699]